MSSRFWKSNSYWSSRYIRSGGSARHDHNGGSSDNDGALGDLIAMPVYVCIIAFCVLIFCKIGF